MTLPSSKLARAGRVRRTLVIGACLAALAPSLASAHDPVFYPARGQSQAQQDNDNFHCYRWAMDQTGFDPMTGRSSTPTQANAARGAVGGAAVGAIGGAIGGNAGLGAAIGAGTGAIVGGARRRSQQNAARDAYNRAFAACMSGRGYTVR